MPVCDHCNDTHRMSLRGDWVMCTRCPVPCQLCRYQGIGAFCENTPCACDCHSYRTKPMQNTQLIVALDVPTFEESVQLVESLAGDIAWVKVGLELYTREGPDVISAMKKRGLSVMLDLKMHDIPETVGRAVSTACFAGADMITVHASGGFDMLAAAQKSASDWNARILAVSVLTSLDDNDLKRVGVVNTVRQQVSTLAMLAAEAGVPGIVCSPREAALVRNMQPGMIIVTPGVRPVDTAHDDQKRVASPSVARASGANYIVVGRPIRDATDRREVVRNIKQELNT